MKIIKSFLVICLCVILTGCGFKKDDCITLKFSTWGSASEMAILTPIIKDFETQNPDIKIEVMHIPQDYFKKLHLLFASNLAPDVVFINNLNIPVYANLLEDLTQYINKDTYFKQALETMTVNNKVYAVPRDVSTLVVYYNKTLFKKYGVPYPDKNWTLEDLLIKSKKLTHKGVWGISYEPLIYYALPYMHYFNEYLFNQEGQQIYDNCNGTEYYKNLAFRYHYAPTPAQTGSKTLAQMFLEEKICMHLSGRWLVPKYRTDAHFEWDVINFPKYASSTDSSGWAISKSSKNKDAAIKFVLFLSNKDNITKMTKDGLIVPARTDVAKSGYFLNSKPANSNAFIEAVENSKPTSVTKDYNKVVDKLTDKVFSN